MDGTFTVRQGRRYRATVELSGLESFADNALIAGKLSDAGFADISVTGRGGTRIAEAIWPLPDKTGDLPARVTSIVEIA